MEESSLKIVRFLQTKKNGFLGYNYVYSKNWQVKMATFLSKSSDVNKIVVDDTYVEVFYSASSFCNKHTPIQMFAIQDIKHMEMSREEERNDMKVTPLRITTSVKTISVQLETRLTMDVYSELKKKYANSLKKVVPEPKAAEPKKVTFAEPKKVTPPKVEDDVFGIYTPEPKKEVKPNVENDVFSIYKTCVHRL